MRNRDGQDNMQEAWAVFTGQTELWWLKFFKSGFRHCYVVLNDGKHWLSVDPLSSYMDVAVHHLPAQFDLPLWLAERGHKVVPAHVSREARQAPWMVFTCVEAVKRVLGIHNRFVFTPWQLYRYLRKQNTYTHHKGEMEWEV